MPNKTTWACDNFRCETEAIASTHIPERWREVLVMTVGDKLNGQRGILCTACVQSVLSMLPPPVEGTRLKGAD